MDGMNELIGDHPAAVVAIFGVLWFILLAQGSAVMWFGRRELRRIEDKEKAQDERLDCIEQEIHNEEGDLRSIREAFEAHVEREERAWDRLEKGVGDIQRKMPNGDLRTVHVKLDNIEEKVDKLDGKVEAHNVEAEMWKRKIERNEVRLDHLEGGRR